MEMSKADSLEAVSFKPVTGLVITNSVPEKYENSNVAFKGVLPHIPEKRVGYIEGKIKNDEYGELSHVFVEPEWRGLDIGSALFSHFIQHAIDRGVKSITTLAVNERTAHLMGTIANAKAFNILVDGEDPEAYSWYDGDGIAELLTNTRKRLYPNNPNGSDELETPPYRIVAKLK